ncbi:putative RNA-directed DNA polymerase [Helianthus annuus]|uniref:RNA-directed DNA polymerase n=1 Tax=Helianthus annuus TaxID=4232 RepID=A0A9K3GZC2_HELAN|nr:putative RNA-directed DNA polymerase [Helianthus annuus]KAJ0822472.1 putative RNA-directed DNA polymerase [Helianthus annuus]
MAGCKTLSDTDGALLTRRFSQDEIRKAVFECGADRAPGPDGFNFRFFKHFWSLFESDFVNILEAFFSSGSFSRGCAGSFIALIPKVKDPAGLGDYRPISLVGAINKVISKILANRLKAVLGSVISESQSAFIKGKFILDGPLVVSEVYSWLKKGGKAAFLLKIDFEKAYDFVNWNFVIDILEKMGFPPRWCVWIKGILSSARASVLVNGSPTFDFPCSKGMRQGDPLSPFLFLIVTEALSFLINKAVEKGLFKGICLPNSGPCVSHLFFADNAIIMGEWSAENVKVVIRILRCFYICSGLKMNIRKSNIYGIGVDHSEVESVAGSIGCKPDGFPFKYLGITVGANMNRICNWRPVYDVFESRLSLWKASGLSIAGRVTLIKSVLESLPNYYFSLFKAPVRVVKDLEKMMRRFLWGGSMDKSKLHWVAWDRVASPVRVGGLGLRNLTETNVALLLKWGWRFKNEVNNFWVKVINAIHCHKFSWDFLPLRASINGVWRNIHKVCSGRFIEFLSLKSLMGGVVGNGQDLFFWLDPWLSSSPLKDEFPHLFWLEKNKKCKVKERIVRPVSNPGGKWMWRSVPSSNVELAEWSRLSGLLRSAFLSDHKDRWDWLGSGSNGFSVKAVKDLFDINKDFSSRFVWEWCRWIPKKCNLFAWRAEQDRIPTREALCRRNIRVDDNRCPLCNSEVETVDHLFSACGVSAVIWQKIQVWCNSSILFTFSFRDILEVHNWVGLEGHKKEVFHGIAIIACWRIWKARNALVFEGKPFVINEVFSDIRSWGFVCYNNRMKDKCIDWKDWCRFVFV